MIKNKIFINNFIVCAYYNVRSQVSTHFRVTFTKSSTLYKGAFINKYLKNYIYNLINLFFYKFNTVLINLRCLTLICFMSTFVRIGLGFIFKSTNITTFIITIIYSSYVAIYKTIHHKSKLKVKYK